MYHISDIKHFNKCPIYYYLNKKSKNTFFTFFKNDYNLVDIIKDYFDIKDCFVGNVGDNHNLVLENIVKYNYFINPRFAYQSMRVKASLLVKREDAFDLYIFKPNIRKELDTDTFYITKDVLEKNNLKIDNLYMINVNRDYVLKDTIDYKQLLSVTDTFNDIPIKELVNNIEHVDYLATISNIETYDEQFKFDKKCLSCENLNYCMPNIEDDSILHLVSSQYKFDMYKDGCSKLKDAQTDKIDATSLQYAQIKASMNNGLFVDKVSLKSFLDSFKHNTVSFIDFEWDSYLFPVYNNMKCFSILPFEYSLCVLNNDGSINKHTYVGTKDCREEFINDLLNNIPSDGPIVAYNAFSAEVLRLKELGEQFPNYKDRLEKLCNRFIDIAEVFSKGIVYDLKYKGQLSLKNILAVISGISYNEFDIKNGLDAIKYHREYEKNNDDSIKEDLIKYCNQDAYGMIVVYNYLLSLL